MGPQHVLGQQGYPPRRCYDAGLSKIAGLFCTVPVFTHGWQNSFALERGLPLLPGNWKKKLAKQVSGLGPPTVRALHSTWVPHRDRFLYQRFCCLSEPLLSLAVLFMEYP